MMRLLLAIALCAVGTIVRAEDDKLLKTLRGHESWVQSVAVSPDSKWVASGSDDQTLRVWDLERGTARTLREFESAVTTVAISRDGKRIAVGTWFGHLEICDARTGKVLVKLPGHQESITTVLFDPTSKYVASGSSDDTLAIWDAASGKELLTFEQGNEYDVTTAAFSPDGRRIVTGGGENELKVWDTENGEEVMKLTGHKATVTSAAYSPDGKSIVSASWDKSLRLWDAENGKFVASLTGHTADITSVTFSPSGNQVISAGEDKTVRIWDVKSRRLTGTLTGHQHSILCMAAARNGRFVVSGGKRSIRIWQTALDVEESFPPGWLPVASLDKKPTWREVRDIQDRIHLYLPNGNKPVRGVFACFVFHSGDPRELADLWNFALVTVPWPFEYDLGHNDKRNGRYKLGHPSQDMGLFLRYLDRAAKEMQHPELSTVPIVGWLGQNGSRECADLYARAPQRVLAWSDSFPNRLRQYPELTKKIPFPFAWEISKKDLRSGQRSYKKDSNPPADLSCRATTYGFGHGIYSKFNFFMFYLDRCVAMRMPDEMPPPGEPVKLKPAVREAGWVGDFDPIGSWNPIAAANSEKFTNAKYPVWFPDEYAAWSWRSYHSSCTDLAISSPKVTYRKKDGKWGGPECGLGYGGTLSAEDRHTFSANVKGDYAKVEFHDGHHMVGVDDQEPWKVENVKLERGLRVLFAVGVRADGSRAASRPAMAIVK